MAERGLTRRRFLACTGRAGAVGGALLLAAPPWLEALFGRSVEAAARGASPLAQGAPEASYWSSVAGAAGNCARCHADADALDPAFEHDPRLVKCFLCAHECAIQGGERGRCRVRENVGGTLRTLSYGRPAAVHTDPIEKKPFYHFLPGSLAYSIGTAGCPLRCRFCQNWELSQASPEDLNAPEITPAAIVRGAERNGAPVIAFTYNEPTVFFEYIRDIVNEGKPRGIRHVLVSCGFMNSEPLAEFCTILDAIKIDLKGYSEDFYRNVCGADLAPVLRTIRTIAAKGVHLEIVNLVVPTLNDSEEDLKGLCEWVVGEAGPDVPVHFTRFHPDYQLMNLPPTPISTLERAREIALAAGLRYPYVGNVPGHPGNHTFCPGCGEIVVERRGFSVRAARLKGGACEACGTAIAGLW
ncbi:MAG: AmmeMemoRadiSam system radical SAM enzyme [Candidatus Eisenbacteria bacterium]|nr:AmmeMemoRadiSam system radical SAM enzyme [Candidatus Eisenbacteria bacterium]